MHLHTYFLALAEDAEDARSTVSSWINDHFEREFYDYGGLYEPEEVHIVSEITKRLEDSRRYTDEVLVSEIKDGIEKYKKSGNRDMEGYYYVRYGNILQESFCADMPYFNISYWDWSIPTEVPEDAKGNQWFAVRVDLHF